MTVALPTNPNPWTVKPRLLDFGGDMTPPLGGAAQRFARIGSRFAVDVTLPPMEAPLSLEWIGARLAARGSGDVVLLNWPQAPAGVSWGAPTVNGASQAGLTLETAGWGANLPPAGTFFSFVGPSGRNYLHVLTQQVTASGGASLLEIMPMIRESPASGAALQFNTPQIMGFIAGPTEEWTRERLAWDTMTFTIQERA
jgi:hypothetical protein